MARLTLAAAPPLPLAAPPPVAERQVALWSDDAGASAPWCAALAAEHVGVHAAAIDARAAMAPPPDAALLHLSHSLAAQLHRVRELRAAWPSLPLVVACRQLRDLDHVLALEMGADDAIDTTLAAPVVAARLRALWRRCGRDGGGATATSELRFGMLELNLAARRVLLGGVRIVLTEGEFEVLWLLAAHAGQTIARRDLLRCVRGLDDHPTDRSIDSRVYRLRAKLGDAAQQRIRTVRHRGYLFSPGGW